MGSARSLFGRERVVGEVTSLVLTYEGYRRRPYSISAVGGDNRLWATGRYFTDRGRAIARLKQIGEALGVPAFDMTE